MKATYPLYSETVGSNINEFTRVFTVVFMPMCMCFYLKTILDPVCRNIVDINL